MLKMARFVYRETKQKNLCLAGGVALNCVSNGRLLRESKFTDIWIQPASGDAGGALGAALVVWYQYLDRKRVFEFPDAMRGSYLGPEFSSEEIKEYLDGQGINYRRLDHKQIPGEIATLIARQKVIGLFEGRMEFGPRALGNRSILGDARSAKTQKIMNLKIKFRESFRPFAPSVLEEDAKKYFDLDRPSPYMLLVAPVKKSLRAKRSTIPAVTHVDYSARIQTVNKDTNRFYYDIISAFKKKTGCAVVVNTSFNVRGEPIVGSPRDAYRCFRRTQMDYLLIGEYLLDKKKQKTLKEATDWRQKFKLD
jgi:carbamoyltransferase